MTTTSPLGRFCQFRRYSLWSDLRVLRLVLSVFLTGYLLSICAAHAQGCVECLVESSSVAADKAKCGFEEFVVSSPPRYYLEKHFTRMDSFDDGGPSTETIYIYQVDWFDPDEASDPTPPNCNLGAAPRHIEIEGSVDETRRDGGDPCSATLGSSGWDDGGDCFDKADPFFWNLDLQYAVTATTESYWYTDDEYEVERNTELLVEYTDALLRSKLIAKLPQFTEFSEWVPGSGIAFYELSSDHVCTRGGRMIYHFTVPRTVRDTTYRIDWERVSVFPDGSIQIVPMSEEFEGTGSEWQSGDHLEEVPETPSTVTIRNVSITVLSTDDDSGDNSGTPGNGSFGGDAGSCAGCSSGDSAEVPANSWGVDFRLSLGRALLGRSAGFLMIARSTPHPSLSTPDALYYSSSRPDIEVIPQVRPIRQIFAPQALADIVVIDPYKYDIRFYFPSQVGAKVGDEYQVSGDPFVTWTIENPAASAEDYDELKITESRGSESRIYRYAYSSPTHSWLLVQPGEEREYQLFALAESPDLRSQELIVRKPGGSDAYRIYRKFEQFDWGEGLVQVKEGNPGSAETTTYTYYAEPNFEPNGTVLPVEQITYSDSSWERFQYDTEGRITLRLASFANVAPTWSETECRSTVYSYEPLSGSGDTGEIEPRTPRTVIEKVLGHEVGRRYTVVKLGERHEIVCQTPGALWTASDNLITLTKYYTSGSEVHRVASVRFPDGTMAFYTYTDNVDGTRTTVVETGQPNGELTAITDGTLSATISGPLGHRVSVVTEDIASSIVTSSQVYSVPDAFDRPQRATFLDGTCVETWYSCCGIDRTVDRDGAATEFTFDLLGRQVASTRHGITTTKILDAAGRTLVLQRVGTDLSVITLSQAAYDTAGRVTSQTNALLGETTITETIDGSGQRVRTTTYHDGGTRIETFFRDGQVASVTGTAVQPIRYEYGVETDGGVYRLYTEEIKLDPAFADTAEWAKTYQDMVGRPYKTLYAGSGSPHQESFFNSQGQLWKTRDPDGVITLHQYDGQGRLVTTATDMDQDSVVDRGSAGSTDRVRDTLTTVTTYSGSNVQQGEKWVYGEDGSAATNLVAVTRVSTDGLQSWSTVYRDGSTPVVTQTRTVFAGNGNRYVTNTAPDESYVLSAYFYGRLISVTRRDSAHGQLGQTTFGYDAHGRQATVTDARNGTTSFEYNDADQVIAVTTPAPGTGQPAQTTVTHYNAMLQVTNIVQPDGASLTNEYHLTGLLARTYGSRSYPVGYGYDAQGRMTTMTNWTAFEPDGAGSGERITTWAYDPYRGWLSNKRYPDDHGPDYGYTPSGRLESRTWARGNPRITTTYAYNNAGDLWTVSYADDPAGTQGRTYTYDRRGRGATVAQGSMTTTFHYNQANQLIGESYSGGTLGGLAMTNLYDSFLRRTFVAAKKSTSTLASASSAYDTGGRLSTATDGSWNSTYSYLANSPLVSQITHKQSTTIRMTETRQYDLLNRLTSISSAPAGAGQLPVSFAYQYNDANQRVRATLQDGSYWVYEYDGLGQVVSGKRFLMDGSPVPGQQSEYGFDDIGNRTTTAAGGNAAGTGLRSATYSANGLNQYTSRTVPGAFDVAGIANANETVTVNGSAADYRRGEYFQELVNVDNSSALVWSTATVTTSGGGSTSGKVFVPQTPENFEYDLDGNLTSDGRWTYVWDAENRLIQMTPLAGIPDADVRRLNFAYDHQGRRIWKRVDYKVGGNWTTYYERKFLHDGWNLIAELWTNDGAVKKFLWGLDLSGQAGPAPNGAGGVGGLLKVWDYYTWKDYFAGYDGNGNVTLLTAGTDGTVAARFEYGPFGEAIRSSGTSTISASTSAGNPFRFSTKYTDAESDFLYYGFRYYSPSTGRWLSRDPIGENGGVNLSAFVANAPISRLDKLGLEMYCQPCGKCGPDVTDAVRETLKEIEAAFRSANWLQKGMLCGNAIKPDGWDINELAYTSTAYQMWYNSEHSDEYEDAIEKGEGPDWCGCDDTVVVQGRCMKSHQASYIMGGLLAKLCSGLLPFPLDPQPLAHYWIERHKREFWSEEPNSLCERQAKDLFDYGYASSAIPCENDLSQDCAVRAEHSKTRHAKFNWTWLGLREREWQSHL